MLMNATAVPIVIGAEPCASAIPAIQETIAGTIVRLARRLEISHLPLIAAFIRMYATAN